MLDLQEFGGVVARLQVSEFREYANWHHESLGDASAELDGADADGFLQHIAVPVTPGAEAAVVKEGEAFGGGRQCRVDFEIDGAVSGAEFIASSDDAPGFAGDGDHVQAVGFGDGGGGCDGDDGCEFSHGCDPLGFCSCCIGLFCPVTNAFDKIANAFRLFSEKSEKKFVPGKKSHRTWWRGGYLKKS